MKNGKILSVILAVISAALAVLSYIILPDTVVIQLSAGASNTEAPKLLAVLIPTALGIGGAISAILTKEGKSFTKSLIVSAVGIAVFIFMIAVNTFMK